MHSPEQDKMKRPDVATFKIEGVSDALSVIVTINHDHVIFATGEDHKFLDNRFFLTHEEFRIMAPVVCRWLDEYYAQS